MATADVGVSLTLSVRDERALIANLHRYDDAIVADVVATNVETSEAIRALAFQLAPVDRDVMRQKIKVAMSPSGLVFEVGYDDRDFISEGLEPYYWFQELGFTHYQSGEFIRNPHLEPAHRAYEAPHRAAIRQRVQRSIQQLSVRTR